jgi:phosphoesterase RecJ-like protein
MADVVRRARARKIVIDHHVSEDDLGATMFKDTSAESTGRLVLQAIDALGISITRQIAEPLFAAIATDTGWFRFASVTDETFSATARLAAAGARPHVVFAALYEQNSLARVRLQGRILTNITSHLNGRLLSTSITQADLRAANAEPTDTEDVINRLLGVTGVEVAILFLELGPKETKVSLRSRSPVDVRAIAEQLGGGGHRAAAGVRFPGPLAAAESTVLTAVTAAMSENMLDGPGSRAESPK